LTAMHSVRRDVDRGTHRGDNGLDDIDEGAHRRQAEVGIGGACRICDSAVQCGIGRQWGSRVVVYLPCSESDPARGIAVTDATLAAATVHCDLWLDHSITCGRRGGEKSRTPWCGGETYRGDIVAPQTSNRVALGLRALGQ